MEDFKFNEKTHEYTLGDKVLPSVTQILEKTLYESKYEGVNEETLKNAAERGSHIHREIETYIKTGGLGFTDELYGFIQVKEQKKFKAMQSEVKVHNDEMAGTIDLLAKRGTKNILADIKTTYKLDKSYVSWQLSFYAYILEHTSDIKIDELYAIWLREDKAEIYKVERKTDKQVEDTLDAFKKGIKIDFHSNTLQTIPQEQQLVFRDILRQIKNMEKKAETFKQAILKEMEDRGVDKVQIGDVSITYVPAGTKKSIDSKKMKEDGIYEDYIKESNVKSSIRINIKED